MKAINRHFFCLSALIFIFLLLTACGNAAKKTGGGQNDLLDETIIGNDDSIAPQNSIDDQSTLNLSITISDPGTVIEWKATGGTFDDNGIATPTWTPPVVDLPLQYTIEVTATLADGHFDTASADITVFKQGGPFTINDLFIDGSWLTANSTNELCGIAYDGTNDYLFITKCVSNGDNEIIRYDFSTQSTVKAYAYPSQWDYGARIIDGELWILRSYDNSIYRLSVDTLPLQLTAEYDDSSTPNAFIEIRDISLANGNLYLVSSNMLTSDHHNGIQYLQGPAYTTIAELLSAVDSMWSPDAANRSIVTVGSGATANLVIATGTPPGAIELRNLSGTLVDSVPDLGSSYLATDSQDRIYAISGFGANTTIHRFPADLSSSETFVRDIAAIGGGNRYVFALRENPTDIEIIITNYRDRDPRFISTTVSK